MKGIEAPTGAKKLITAETKATIWLLEILSHDLTNDIAAHIARVTELRTNRANPPPIECEVKNARKKSDPCSEPRGFQSLNPAFFASL